jgi:hypothetical protein
MVESCKSPKLQQPEMPEKAMSYNPNPMAAMTGAMVTGEMYLKKMVVIPVGKGKVSHVQEGGTSLSAWRVFNITYRCSQWSSGQVQTQ